MKQHVAGAVLERKPVSFPEFQEEVDAELDRLAKEADQRLGYGYLKL